MRFRPEFPSGGTRRTLPREQSEAPPEDVSAERHRPCTGRGKCYNHFHTRPLQPRSAQADGDYLEPIQYADTFVPAPRTRTETRRQAEMRHGQIASPTRTEDVRFPSADRRTFQLRANKQYVKHRPP